jgi:magnesium-transporting ATPase (P-type)
VVINTGFTTHRGRIIRKIMNRTIKDPDIIRTTLIFVMEVVIVSIITFFATLFLLLRLNIDPIFIFFKFLDFLASSAPPPLPIFFNLAYSLSLFRLGFKGIIGT